jgi:hypothetical protein
MTPVEVVLGHVKKTAAEAEWATLRPSPMVEYYIERATAWQAFAASAGIPEVEVEAAVSEGRAMGRQMLE